MKIILLFCTVLVCSISSGNAQSKSGYKYTVDLTRVVEDRVFVELSNPKISTQETIFYLPKIIPGTYSIADYGRFIYDLKALDKKGKELKIQRLDSNSWKISDATRLTKITYWVDDILDAKKEGPQIYPMAATNIEEGKNFVINTSGFFGYLDSNTKSPVNFDVIRPKDFYGSTGLIALQTGEPLPKVKNEISTPENENKRIDRYYVDNYDRLIDSPLMYARPDTAIINVNGTEVLIGSYSPTGKISASEIASTVKEVLMAQASYLGGKLPVSKYAFIFYFVDKPLNSYGALEHWYSSFYYMPEMTLEKIQQQLRDFAAHEFFHIVTPLNIHSEEIQSFGFNDPKMSKHLWMYEGVTEYFAGNVQVQYGLITPEQYLNIIRQKMIVASGFLDEVPFTDISKFTLDKYSDQYYNVYQKGALIGMCLDIKLRSLSNGKYGMKDLMADLAKKYGKSQPFHDEELFSTIEKLTFPEIGRFFDQYVGGPQKLPFEETFAAVGVHYTPEKSVQEFSLGYKGGALMLADLEGKKKLAVRDSEGLNEQGVAVGLKQGDIFLKINGKTIPEVGPDLSAFLTEQKNSLTEGSILSFTVVRKNDQGDNSEVELKAPAMKINRSLIHLLEFDEQANQEQLALRNSWLHAGK
jgi:predicted metalloprotease with PDZ domain